MTVPFTTYPRIVLGVVAILYIALGIMFSLDPKKLGDAMGYNFKGNGIIEFVVIYGGLELGMGLAMLVATMNRALFPGIYFMSAVISLALPIARIWMLIPREMEGKMGALLIIEFVVLAAFAWPFLHFNH